MAAILFRPQCVDIQYCIDYPLVLARYSDVTKPKPKHCWRIVNITVWNILQWNVYSKYRYLCSRKRLWTCCLQEVGHFLSSRTSHVDTGCCEKIADIHVTQLIFRKCCHGTIQVHPFWLTAAWIYVFVHRSSILLDHNIMYHLRIILQNIPELSQYTNVLTLCTAKHTWCIIYDIIFEYVSNYLPKIDSLSMLAQLNAFQISGEQSMLYLLCRWCAVIISRSLYRAVAFVRHVFSG